MGPSIESLDAIKPIPPWTTKFLSLPSFIEISKTLDNLPPYCAGIPPLIRDVLLIASPLKIEKKPNKWPVL